VATCLCHPWLAGWCPDDQLFDALGSCRNCIAVKAGTFSHVCCRKCYDTSQSARHALLLHLQSNGNVVLYIRTGEKHLRIVISVNQRDWHESCHSSCWPTKLSPTRLQGRFTPAWSSVGNHICPVICCLGLSQAGINLTLCDDDIREYVHQYLMVSSDRMKAQCDYAANSSGF
jgi:hypothetical protein